ncbi:hypothetical protein [Marinilactibacillus psychrotolerans]|uniref:Uncharacterized protein n=1 Tax=Marinilactibacillus psychrotolerans TaxID=191770 RepID=A0A5R9BWG4_9LACT|nr:hypothetical protein [Marinilactibacillus psychrotolerans]TLQ05048.1 hypothetical protein FEZ48_12910 [Marinilactibacillus psychrotolerans]
MKKDLRIVLKFGLPFLLLYMINGLLNFIDENFISTSEEIQLSLLLGLLILLGKFLFACLCTYIIFELAKRRNKGHFLIDTLAFAIKWILSFLFFPIVNNIIGVPLGNLLPGIEEASWVIIVSLIILLAEFLFACLCASFIFEIAEHGEKRPLRFPKRV